MVIKSNFILILILTLVSCRPPQEATEYSITEENIIGLEDIDENSPINEQTLKTIQQKCQELAALNQLESKMLTVTFPKAYECNFGENGNGSRVDSKVRARMEQYSKLDIDEKIIICDMKFEFPEQSMQYDDEILLTLNNYVLMMSTNYSQGSEYNQYKEKGLAFNNLGLPVYKWSGENGLFDLDYGHKLASPYCLGVAKDDLGNCNVPATETNAQIKLNIPNNEIIKIGLTEITNNNQNSNFNFGFISTGDNDNGDCEHSEFEFETHLKYFVP